MIRLLFLVALLVGSPAAAQQPQYFPLTGGMKVELIPNGKLADTFNDPSTLDTTNTWNAPTTSGTGAATYSQGQEVLSSGTTAGSSALIRSQTVFQINSPAFLLWRGAINSQTEIAANCKQMGFFIAAGSPTCAAPVTDGILFEITSSTTPSGTAAGGLAGAGKLQAVTYAGGTRTLLADLSVTISGINWAPIFASDGSVVCPGRNTPQAFTDTCPHILDIWFNGNSAEFDVDFKPVAFMLVGSLGPNNNALPWSAQILNGGSAIASTIKINQAVVGDEARNTIRICDPTYPWRCAKVDSGGTVSVAGGFDSGPITATATPANSSHAAGVSVGGLFSIPLVRVSGGAGILTGFLWKSVGGDTGQKLARIWAKNPTGTTCTDNSNFVGADADDAFLIGPGPFAFTPGAPVNVQGDTATYAAVSGVTWDYKNLDTVATQNVYVCVVTNATDTADQNKIVRITLSGPQD